MAPVGFRIVAWRTARLLKQRRLKCGIIVAITRQRPAVGTFALVQREMDRLVDAQLSAQLDVVVDALEAGQDLPQPGFGQEVAVLLAHRTLGGLSFPIPSQSDGTYDFDSSDHVQPEFRYLIKNRFDGRIVIAEMTERQEELRQILGGGVSVSLLGTLLAGLLAGSWLAWRSQIRLDIISEGLALVPRFA